MRFWAKWRIFSKAAMPDAALPALMYFCAMEQLLQQIEDLKKEISAFTATDDKQVEEFRIKWLGTKGVVKAIMGEMKNVPVEKKKEETPKVIPAVVKEELRTSALDYGYFKTSFDQQVKARPISRDATVTSGIFKTLFGVMDAKYYMLMDGVSPGTVIKITNPDNNKAVYVKVLGGMSGIRQNQGYDIRISNAAASALQVTEDEKFIVRVNY